MTIAFKKPNIEEVLSLIQKELKDISIESMTIQSIEGAPISPIYNQATHTINTPLSNEYRVIFQLFTIDKSNIDEINHKIINSLENGQNGLILDFQRREFNIDEIAALFHNIRLDYIHTEFLNITSNTENQIRAFIQHYTEKLSWQQTALSSNVFCIADNLFIAEAAKFIVNAKQNKGYIHIELRGDYFWDIAKMRAMKTILWNYCRLEKIPFEFFFIGETSSKNKSTDHLETNILKLTTEAMSAIIGGCEGLWIKPFDGKSDNEFSTRISRNIFHLMQEESYLNLVNDPSSGSYFIENYTEQIARQIYKELEKTNL